VHPQGVFSAGVRCLTAVASCSARYPPGLLHLRGLSLVAWLGAFALCVRSWPWLRWRFSSRRSLSANLADLQRLPATGGGLSSSRCQVNRRGVSGLSIPAASRPPEPLSASATVHYFARRPVSASKLASPCSLQGLPLRLHAAGSSPAAPPMVFFPPSGCALSRSPLQHRSAARSPPGHSPRLRGSGVPGCPCLSARLRSWPCLSLGSVVAHGLLRSRAFSVFPPGSCAPLSPAKPAALAFLACSFVSSVGSHPLPQRPLRGPDKRSSKASRPAFRRAALQGVPRLLPAITSSVVAPLAVFFTPSGVRVQPASVASAKQAVQRP